MRRQSLIWQQEVPISINSLSLGLREPLEAENVKKPERREQEAENVKEPEGMEDTEETRPLSQHD